MTNLRKLAGTTVALGALFAGSSALAQGVEEFYAGNTVTLIVSASPGGGADLYARAFAPFLSEHMPGNPDVVVTNLPGAGGLTAATQLQTSEARDGTVIAVLQRNNLYLPIVSSEEIAFDPREVNWVGSLNKETYALVAWDGAGIETFDDLTTVPFVIGATSFNNENRTFPEMINRYLGGQIDIIPGYEGNDEIALAMERGEVQGRALTITSLLGGNDANWLREGKIHVVAQMGVEPHAAIPDAPMVLDRVEDPDARALFEFMFLPLQAGRPFAAPPEVPEDRLAALRTAFEEAALDPDFVAEVAKQNATVEMIPGAEVEAIVEQLYATPEPVLESVRGLLTEEG